jgi:hypothetical protein
MSENTARLSQRLTSKFAIKGRREPQNFGIFLREVDGRRIFDVLSSRFYGAAMLCLATALLALVSRIAAQSGRIYLDSAQPTDKRGPRPHLAYDSRREDHTDVNTLPAIPRLGIPTSDWTIRFGRQSMTAISTNIRVHALPHTPSPSRTPDCFSHRLEPYERCILYDEQCHFGCLVHLWCSRHIGKATAWKLNVP